MTTYNTGNPLGSSAAKDLYDNAQNLDVAVNSITQVIWSDRFGKSRRSYWGMEQAFSAQLLSQEQRFNLFIQNSGYEVIGDYEDGPLTITEYNQLIRYDGELWKITAATDIPFTTTGNDINSWAVDSVHFVSVGDGALRQEVFTNEMLNMSPLYYGAKGDGVTDDTSAFELLENETRGRVIDLGGHTYNIKKPIFGNSYENGYFKINDSVHPAQFIAEDIKTKKYCCEFYTGDTAIVGQNPIFDGAGGTFQAFCIVPSGSVNKVYVTQRATGPYPFLGNFLKNETYRIVEYTLIEDGSQVANTAFSQPLTTCGHASMIGYKLDGDQLYLFTGSPNASETDVNLGGKGFTKVRWNGSSTSDSDVTQYEVFDQPTLLDGNYPSLCRANVTISDDGEYLCLLADDSVKGDYVTLIYNLEDMLLASNVKTLKPLYEFRVPPYYGNTLQGVTLNKSNVICYYDSPVNTATVRVFDFNGNCVSTIENVDLIRSIHSRAGMLGGDGVLQTFECENIYLFANDLYVGMREIWSTMGTVVSYNGAFFTPIMSTTGNAPSDVRYWMPVDITTGATPYSPSTAYTVTGTRKTNKKHIFKISSVHEDGSETLQGLNNLSVPPGLQDPNLTYSANDGNFSWRRWVDNLQSYLYTLHMSSTGNLRIYNTSSDSLGNAAGMFSMYDTQLGSVRNHGIRIRGGETVGGNTTWFAQDDSTFPGAIVEYAGASNSLVRSTSQYGETIFKGISVGTVPLRADVNGTGDFIRGSRNDTPYFGIRVSTANTIMTSRSGNSFVIGASSSIDGTTSDTTVRVNINIADMALRPDSANNIRCGNAAFPWSGGSTQIAFTVTSDMNAKTDIAAIPDSVLDAWGDVDWYSYRLKQEVSIKSDAAENHSGILAQEILAAFIKHGVDAIKWGVVQYSSWDDIYDEDTGEIKRHAGELYEVNYTEAFSIECARNRRELLVMKTDFEYRLTILEEKL